MKVSQDEENQLIQRMRENPELARRVLEMTDIIDEDLEGVDLADDAEEIVVENIRKTGKELKNSTGIKKNTEQSFTECMDEHLGIKDFMPIFCFSKIAFKIRLEECVLIERRKRLF